MREDALSPLKRNPRLRKIGRTVAKCPSCGRYTLIVEDYLYDAPLIGLLLISQGKCSNCGYRFSDVRAAESKGPRRLVFRVRNPDDLDVLVVKAASATIKIPEIGVEISPGPASQGYITTVEGVLHRIREVVEGLCLDPQVNRNKCVEKLGEIDELIRCSRPFTLIIDDPEGTSRIISDKVEKEKLYRSSTPP